MLDFLELANWEQIFVLSSLKKSAEETELSKILGPMIRLSVSNLLHHPLLVGWPRKKIEPELQVKRFWPYFLCASHLAASACSA